MKPELTKIIFLTKPYASNKNHPHINTLNKSSKFKVLINIKN